MLMNPTGVQPNPTLLQYIQSQSSQGWTYDQIITSAKNAGWPDAQIEACMAWINNNYVAQQMAVNQMFNGPAQPVQQYSPIRQTQNSTPAKAILAILFIVIAVVVALLLMFLPSTKASTEEKVFKNTIENGLKLGSFQQKYEFRSAEKDTRVSATTESDFSDPANPKTNAIITVSTDLGEKTTGGQNTLTATYNSIVLGDTVWIKPIQITADFDSATRSSYAAEATNKQTVEQVLLDKLDIGPLDSWQMYFANATSLDSIAENSFTSATVHVALALNTVFGRLILCNYGPNASDAAALILNSGAYTISGKPTRETLDGKNLIKYNVRVKTELLQALHKKLSDQLKLSDRHLALESDALAGSTDPNFTLWIDPSKNAPYKVDVNNGETVVKYDDFGAQYTYSAPI